MGQIHFFKKYCSYKVSYQVVDRKGRFTDKFLSSSRLSKICTNGPNGDKIIMKQESNGFMSHPKLVQSLDIVDKCTEIFLIAKLSPNPSSNPT